MKGQSVVELLVYSGLVIATLIAMSFYVQRGYQGYLYSTNSSHGPQFDYQNNAWRLNQQLNRFNQKQSITISSAGGVEMPSGNEDLPTVPGGPIPSRMTSTKAQVTTSWDVRRTPHYEAQ